METRFLISFATGKSVSPVTHCPSTWSFWLGVEVPIPTFPAELTYSTGAEEEAQIPKAAVLEVAWTVKVWLGVVVPMPTNLFKVSIERIEFSEASAKEKVFTLFDWGMKMREGDEGALTAMVVVPPVLTVKVISLEEFC